MWTRFILTLVAACAGFAATAQESEYLRALGARPTGKGIRAKADLNTHFLYQFETREIPFMDDFSADRTRSLDASPNDPGVTLDQTILRLTVGGVGTPDMVFETDTTYTYVTDLAEEPPVTTRVPLPSVMVTVTNVSAYPASSQEIECWPAYNVFDTLQNPPADTLWLSTPDLVQDSLLVFTVPPVSGVLWADDHAYVNNSFALDPPTIGVATFDGLSRTGYPYNFMSPQSYGLADALTSVPINLQYPPGDSIYLSFLFQPKGLSGDVEPQPRDSLVLEFYAPLEDTWVRVWRTPYFVSDDFHQVMVPILQDRFLKNGFRMRFRNYATLSGAFDHWHVDYVRLAGQRTFDDVILVDMAYVYPPTTLLNTYTSVPFHRFSAALMAPSVTLPIRNLDINDRFINYGMSASLTDGTGLVDFVNGLNSSGNAASMFNSTHTVNSTPNNFVYDTGLSEDFAFWKVKFWAQTQPDLIQENDTASFVQELSNYYAYDDGSAEMAYGIGGAGSKLAYRYDLLGGDSLRAIRMYFSPSANLAEGSQQPYQGSFLLTVWKSLDPEVIQHQNFSFSSPEYRMDGPNKFVEYQLDSAIFVDGTIYIGWVQTTAASMNIGFDRNRINSNKIFYKTGVTWQQSQQPGSLMMRPVLVANADPFTGVEEPVVRGNGLSLFPNPANDRFTVRVEDPSLMRATIQCFDATGRMVLMGPWEPDVPFVSSSLAPGTYLVRLVDEQGLPQGHSRLVVQR